MRPELNSITSAIDVGCGVGALVAELSHAGVCAIGFDSDETVIRTGVEKFGANIHVGYVTGLNAHKEFDLLCLSHVVEHFAAPIEDLKALIPRVRKGGWIFIEVPNCASWMFSDSMDAESHLGFYSPAAMKILADVCSLDVVRIQTCGPAAQAFYHSRCRQLHDTSESWANRLFESVQRRMRRLGLQYLPRIWPIRTEYDGYYEAYDDRACPDGMWIRALFRRTGA